ncbi:hypothetical protein JNX00_07285 [Hydrogenophaga sp. YM1]|uniref:hypothetical protein n=1 Tax=Hydrogenophaga sp. YM1 TaxID=2806262 RepID=UPI001955FA69|nr:hypothetical protein [Hydrogenophaga sp. YM1]QRR35656.1 hypothetical protein JNX00_07285 [Hydrogenophaga sp. YM1]
MSLFFLEYDLRKKRDYQSLYDELARFAAVRYLESAWAFKRVNTTAAGLRNHFAQFIDPDDGLMVIEVSDWAGRSLDGDPNKL